MKFDHPNEVQMKFEEVVEVVNELNDAWSKVQDPPDNPFLASTDGATVGVTFFGIGLWDDDTNEDRYNEETDEYTPLKEHLVKLVRDLADSILAAFPPAGATDAS